METILPQDQIVIISFNKPSKEIWKEYFLKGEVSEYDYQEIKDQHIDSFKKSSPSVILIDSYFSSEKFRDEASELFDKLAIQLPNTKVIYVSSWFNMLFYPNELGNASNIKCGFSLRLINELNNILNKSINQKVA